MAKCPKCSAEVSEGAAFCASCGSQITAAAPQANSNHRHCPKCNAELSEGVVFCASCGAQVGAAAPKANSNKLHCPNCKSHNIAISTESSVTGAVTASHGRMSTTSVSNTHRNFWFCSDCGTKFRNIPNLEEEISKSKYTHIIMWIIGAVCAFFSIWIISQMDNVFAGVIFVPILITAFVAAAVFIIMGFVSKSKLAKMKSELEYLKTNCFN